MRMGSRGSNSPNSYSANAGSNDNYRTIVPETGEAIELSASNISQPQPQSQLQSKSKTDQGIWGKICAFLKNILGISTTKTVEEINSSPITIEENQTQSVKTATTVTRTTTPVVKRGNYRLIASPTANREREEGEGEGEEKDEDNLITIAENGVWLNVEKSFGSIHLEKIGLIYKEGEIHFTPQFTVQVADFSLVLNGLSASTPLVTFNPQYNICLLYTSPSPRDLSTSRMPSSA